MSAKSSTTLNTNNFYNCTFKQWKTALSENTTTGWPEKTLNSTMSDGARLHVFFGHPQFLFKKRAFRIFVYTPTKTNGYNLVSQIAIHQVTKLIELITQLSGQCSSLWCIALKRRHLNESKTDSYKFCPMQMELHTHMQAAGSKWSITLKTEDLLERHQTRTVQTAEQYVSCGSVN